MCLQLDERFKKLCLLTAEIEDFVAFLEAIHLHFEAIHDGYQFFQLEVDELLGFQAGLEPAFFGVLDVFLAKDIQEFLGSTGEGVA